MSVAQIVIALQIGKKLLHRPTKILVCLLFRLLGHQDFYFHEMDFVISQQKHTK